MRVKKGLALGLCLCVLLSLTRCAVLTVQGTPVAAEPALQLLSMPAYQDREGQAASPEEAQSHLRVDLWLDASQVMGGVNENEGGIYSRSGRRFRQGGFHYRYGSNTVGWYEDVLKAVLSAAEGSRVRVLRAGNERLPDAFLREMGFDVSEENAARSLRRDLLTYAVDPMPDLFSSFSSETMENSFYSLGTPLLNQMANFKGDSGALLENPDKVLEMSAALSAQLAAFSDENQSGAGALSAVGDDLDSPLRYALDNMDLNRLSVITCDPAALRRISGTDTVGAPVDYMEELLRQRGVFDQGLTVGLYAFQLDYMGQLTSFGAADFADPLIWGRLNYNSRTQKLDSALPMPRVLLMLVVGEGTQVDGFTQALNGLLDSGSAFQGLRGPNDGQLRYTLGGQTVTQQPFSFRYEYADVSRPGAGRYTQHTPGGTLTLPESAGTAAAEGGLYTVTLNQGGAATLEYSWPAAALEDGVSLDLSQLTQVGTEVIDSLLLTQTLPNTKETAVESTDGLQVLTLRDTQYLFARKAAPFADAPEQSPFTLRSVTLSQDGARVVALVDVDQHKLQAGYYRVRITADISGKQFAWPAVAWTENGGGLSTEITNAQVTLWESFMAHFAKYTKPLKSVPKYFDNAWGPAENAAYKGTPVPDFPPVYRAPFLSRLFEQIRAAANVETAPYIRCVFDVFVPDIR